MQLTPFSAAFVLMLAPSALAQQCPQDDIFEDNDTCATAIYPGFGVFPGLTAQDSDPDWYLTYVPPGRTLRAKALFSHGSGNIDVTLEEPCGSLIESSVTLTDDEEIVWTNTSSLGANPRFQVFLTPNSGADCNGYTLCLELDPVVLTTSGLPHTSIGAAHLETTAASKLKISNLGSSGCDGFSVDLGETEGWTADIEDFAMEPDGTNDGLGFRVVATGTAFGLPERPLGEVRADIVGGEWRCQADFTNMMSATYRADVYLGAEYQGSFTGLGNGMDGIKAAFPDQGPCPDGFYWASIGIICASPLGNPVDCNGAFCLLSMACLPITDYGNTGDVIDGDTIYFYPENAPPTGGTVWNAADVFFQYPDTGLPPGSDNEVVVEAESVVLDQHFVTVIDNAEVVGQAAKLKISNLGSSGCDGVSIAPGGGDGDTGEIMVELVALDLVSPTPLDSGYFLGSTGMVQGMQRSLGELEVVQGPTSMKEVRFDFSEVGSSTTIVEVYLGGQLQASLTGQTGLLASCDAWPTGCGKRDFWDPWQFPCFVLTFDGGTSIALDGLQPGNPVMGDELRILAEGSLLAPDSLTSFEVRGRDLDEFQITAISSSAVADTTGIEYCFGDGSGTPCPCGNTGQMGAGCANSSGFGARLIGSGVPSEAADTLHFQGVGITPNSFGVLVSADNILNGGNGVTAFDGLRCVGGNLKRHGSRASNAMGEIDGWGPPNNPQQGLMAQGNFVPGQVRNFQIFYREMTSDGCGTGQNTSTAVSITFLP